MKYYAVKCQQTVTFYINVYAENEWQAQHRAEYIHKEGNEAIGYSKVISDVNTVHAVEIDDGTDNS